MQEQAAFWQAEDLCNIGKAASMQVCMIQLQAARLLWAVIDSAIHACAKVLGAFIKLRECKHQCML